MQQPSVADLTSESNHYSQLARKIWLIDGAKEGRVNSSVVNDELYNKLRTEDFPVGQIVLLEQLQCLERYLWPGYTINASDQHVILITLLVNTKLQAKLPAWTNFLQMPEKFSHYFRAVLRLTVAAAVSDKVKVHLLSFVVGAFQSLDVAAVRKECAPLVSIAIWHNLHSDDVRDRRVAQNVQLTKAWKSMTRRFETADNEGKLQLSFERAWLYTLLVDFLHRLHKLEDNSDARQGDIRVCERVLELLCDISSQLPTKRYTGTLLADLNIHTAIRRSSLFSDEDSKLVRELSLLLEHYMTFPVDEQTGQEWTAKEAEELQNAEIARLQKVALKLQPEKLKILYLSNASSVANQAELQGQLDVLSDDESRQLASELSLRISYPKDTCIEVDREFLNDLLWHYIERRTHFADAVRQMSTSPTEKHLYDASILRTDSFDHTRPLALPKLNLQFLSTGDFLWRSFILSRCEAFYAIKSHLEDTLKRMQLRKLASGKIVFDGFSRMAIPINKPAVVEVAPARVGESGPAMVSAEITLDISQMQPSLRREWCSLRPNDAVFLCAAIPLQQRSSTTNGTHPEQPAHDKAGLRFIRCAEVVNVLDDNGRVLRPTQLDAEINRSRQIRLLVRLDTIAYKADQELRKDMYDQINVLVRRGHRENNFKAVLDSIKSLLVSNSTIPKWLADVYLGFGDPASASYKRLPSKLSSVDFRDTFIDWQHLVEALPGKTVEPDPSVDASFGPPYVLEESIAVESAPTRPTKKRKREANKEPDTTLPVIESVRVTTYRQPNRGPYLEDAPRHNTIRFTATQVEAIASGTQPGLTLIVGPPGTGKTDVATQIISNIYHDFPVERTLLIAHSNQALNQLFAKITALDIDSRHLLRLGHGEEDLGTEASFSKAGRVESFLEQGSKYLFEVQRLAESIAAHGAHGNSCETAAYFHDVFISPAWKRYWSFVEGSTGTDDIISNFPFHTYFANAPQPVMPPDASRSQLIDIAQGCERHIDKIFAELADIRPFELLRNARDKSNYLLIKEARVVAMTSTYAAMRRSEIASLGFQYDNVIVEEAAQITEIENFLPMTLQRQDSKHNLKRIVLVGDHLQNSPIIQNNALRAYANLEQSLFLRLVRLGVPHIMLDAQGRARPSLAALYQWRYPTLTNLPVTLTAEAFIRANAGLRYDYQFLDVQDYKGQGETEPSAHFIQNLGEAEYAVALFQYMRLLGYPAEKISILTAYAGQRALIRDVLSHRCKSNRLFGMPGWLGTIDKYQGEQNDYVILSLVRTKGPGYLRDLRRLTVALSRARLGLYVLGRRDVFESSLELREAFGTLLERSTVLQVVPGELWPAQRQLEGDVESVSIEGVEHLGQYVFEMTRAKVNAIKAGKDVLPAAATVQQQRVPEDDEIEDDEDGLNEPGLGESN